jgi:hypothetical protein
MKRRVALVIFGCVSRCQAMLDKCVLPSFEIRRTFWLKDFEGSLQACSVPRAAGLRDRICRQRHHHSRQVMIGRAWAVIVSSRSGARGGGNTFVDFWEVDEGQNDKRHRSMHRL